MTRAPRHLRWYERLAMDVWEEILDNRDEWYLWPVAAIIVVILIAAPIVTIVEWLS